MRSLRFIPILLLPLLAGSVLGPAGTAKAAPPLHYGIYAVHSLNRGPAQHTAVLDLWGDFAGSFDTLSVDIRHRYTTDGVRFEDDAGAAWYSFFNPGALKGTVKITPAKPSPWSRVSMNLTVDGTPSIQVVGTGVFVNPLRMMVSGSFKVTVTGTIRTNKCDSQWNCSESYGSRTDTMSEYIHVPSTVDLYLFTVSG